MRFALALMLALLLGRAALARAPEIRADIAYGPDPQEKLDLCLPPGGGAARPALVLIHGGAWSRGSRKAAPHVLCNTYAQRGIVVAAIDYRLAGKPGGAWPAQLQDAQLAVRWLRAHAAKLGAASDRICAWGDSAGGHLAVFLAALRETLPGDRAALLAGISPAVACAVDNFGPVELAPLPDKDALRRLADSADDMRVAQVARDASPLGLIGPQTAPIMVVQGDRDTLVPAVQSDTLRAALVRARVPVFYVSYPGGHEFEGLSAAETHALLDLEATFVAAAVPITH